MTTPETAMLPYRREGEIDYAGLDFDPDDPEKPDAMQQHPEQREIVNLLSARFADFDTRANVFIDYDSFICYDRTDLNVRVSRTSTWCSGWTWLQFARDGCTCHGRQGRPRIGRWKSGRRPPAGRT
jgi:hypothetical protein